MPTPNHPRLRWDNQPAQVAKRARRAAEPIPGYTPPRGAYLRSPIAKSDSDYRRVSDVAAAALLEEIDWG